MDEISVSAQNVSLSNGKDLAVNGIHATGTGTENNGGDINMNVAGNVTQAAGGSGISGENLNVTADGNFGTATDPSVTNVDSANVTAANIGIDNHSEKLEVENLTGSNVYVSNDGDIVGSAKA